MEVNRIGVVGAGTMGHGIAQTFAQAGFSVQLVDIAQPVLDRARAAIAASLGKFVERGRLASAARDDALRRISTTTSLEHLAGADYIVEAIIEQAEAKSAMFTRLDAIAKTGAILASNTSSISITALGAATKRPDRVIGMHFMNPVPMMPLVEVIRALQTSQETFETTMKLCEKLEKKPVAVNDSPGFVSNRVLIPLINEAAFCVMEGVAAPEAVDAVMKLGMNHPMGPLELADFIGLDVCLDVMEVLFEGFGDSKFRPCPLLKKMVAAGWLGKKSGRGFHNYSGK